MGAPDLNGVWDFRTLTPIERPEEYGDREFLTEEEARALEQGAVEQNEAADRAPAQRTEAGGSIGAYNRFWMDFGTEVVETRRTSLIVDPPNGRRPPRTDEGRTRFSAPGSFGSAPLEQIEDLSYFDRCLGTTGLPIFPVAYNNNVQIFQTEDHLVMLVEMLNTTRIIPITDRPHGGIRQWLGDSRGRWEGDTLVVETTSFDRWLEGPGLLLGQKLPVAVRLRALERRQGPEVPHAVQVGRAPRRSRHVGGLGRKRWPAPAAAPVRGGWSRADWTRAFDSLQTRFPIGVPAPSASSSFRAAPPTPVPVHPGARGNPATRRQGCIRS